MPPVRRKPLDAGLTRSRPVLDTMSRASPRAYLAEEAHVLALYLPGLQKYATSRPRIPKQSPTDHYSTYPFGGPVSEPQAVTKTCSGCRCKPGECRCLGGISKLVCVWLAQLHLNKYRYCGRGGVGQCWA